MDEKAEAASGKGEARNSWQEWSPQVCVCLDTWGLPWSFSCCYLSCRRPAAWTQLQASQRPSPLPSRALQVFSLMGEFNRCLSIAAY